MYLLPLIALLAVWLPGFNQGAPRTDAHVYAAISLDLLDGGVDSTGVGTDGWSPRLGEADYFNKSPLIFWIHGAALRLVNPEPSGINGVSMWALRLPALLAAAIGVLLTVDTVRRLSGPRAALVSGVALALTLEWFRYTKTISLDLWMAVFFLAWANTLVRSVAIQDRQHDQHPRRLWGVPITAWGWMALGGAALGAGLMTKPFVSAVPLVAGVVWLLVIRKPCLLKTLPIVLLAMLAVALPWHLAMISRHGDAFIDQYLWNQSVSRVASEAHGTGPWWYYASTLVKYGLPWCALALLAALAWSRRTLPARHRPLAWLALITAGLWLVAISLVTDKATRYAVPIYPWVAAGAAVWLTACSPVGIRRGRRPSLDAIVGLIAVVGIGLAIAGIRVHGPPSSSTQTLAAAVQETKAQGGEVYMVGRSRDVASWTYLVARRWPIEIDREAADQPHSEAGKDIVIWITGQEAPEEGEIFGKGNGYVLTKADLSR